MASKFVNILSLLVPRAKSASKLKASEGRDAPVLSLSALALPSVLIILLPTLSPISEYMSCGSACLAISKGADVSKLRDPVRNRQKQKTKHKIAVEAVHNHADMQKNKRN